jgi:hypothetical protein
MEEETQGIREQMEEMEENQEIYEGLTEERLRDVIDEVLEEADQAESTEPHPTRIMMDAVEHTVQDVRDAVAEEPQPRRVLSVDVADIPPGMTAEEVVNHYRTSGNTVTFTDTTGVRTDATTGTYTDSPTVARAASETRTGDLLDELFVNKEEKPMKEEPEKPNYTAEEIADFRLEKRILQKQQTQYATRITVSDITFSNNDLLIPMNSRMPNYLYHHDLSGNCVISDRGEGRARARLRRRNTGTFQDALVFDKDGNSLIRDTRSPAQVSDRPMVSDSQCATSRNQPLGGDHQFVVVDKRAYVESRGRVMKIKKRHGIKMIRVIEYKRKWMERFALMDEFLAFAKAAIEQIMPKEDFDIIFEIGGRNNSYNMFSIVLKYHDITIRNSIEMERHLGTMIVRSDGTLRFSRSEGRLKSGMIGSIKGTRLTFTPVDAVLNYQHSHLTSSMNNFNGFCTGSESYRTEGYMDEFDLQSHIIKIGEFLKWESLEGGPHMKMETLHLYGPVQQIKQGIFLTDREVGQSYIDVMINEINKTKEKFTSFASAYSLINNKGSLKFVVDYTVFFKLFIELFGEKIVTLHKGMGERLYIYNPVENQFHKVANTELTDPVKVLRTAKSHMVNFRPIYLNGGILQSHLETEEIANLTDGVIFSPEPNFMKEVAQMILFKLTEKLEKDGNTLKNKGEG